VVKRKLLNTYSLIVVLRDSFELSIYYTFNIQQLACADYLFGFWLKSFSPMIRNEIFVGMAVMCWALWMCRNDVGLNGTKTESLVYMDIGGHNDFFP